jgi:hypothetical protein
MNLSKTLTRSIVVVIGVISLSNFLLPIEFLYYPISVAGDNTLSSELTGSFSSTKEYHGINPPTIYLCTKQDGNGFEEAKALFSSVLPEYKIKILEESIIALGRKQRIKRLPDTFFYENFTNSYDILLDSFSLSCQIPPYSSWIQTRFNGHIILFSPESPRDHPISRVSIPRDHMHAFGPLIHPQRQDMVLTYLQFVWWHRFKDILTPTILLDNGSSALGSSSSLRPKGNNASEFMIYANSNCVPFREEAVGLLSEIGVVHCDGRCQGKTPPSGNRTNLVQTNLKDARGVTGWHKNIEIYSKYRFCFVMEHEEDHPTYITEKILMAFIAGMYYHQVSSICVYAIFIFFKEYYIRIITHSAVILNVLLSFTLFLHRLHPYILWSHHDF